MMKKLFLVAALALGSLALSAQTYKPFVNAGASVASNTLSYEGQVGFASTTSRYAATLAFTDNERGVSNTVDAGVKGSWKLNPQSTRKVGLYGTGAVKVGLDDEHSVTYEPGFAALFAVDRRFTPQVSVGFPLVFDGSRSAVGVSLGVSVNLFK